MAVPILPANSSYKALDSGLLELFERTKRTGENFLETMRRIGVHEALAKTQGQQLAASRLLNVSPRVLNYWCKDLGLRPMDRREKERAAHAKELASQIAARKGG